MSSECIFHLPLGQYQFYPIQPDPDVIKRLKDIEEQLKDIKTLLRKQKEA